MFLLSKVHTYPNLKFLKHGLKRDARTVIYHNTIYPGPYIFQPIYYHLPANFSCSPHIPNFSVTTHQSKLYPSYTATSLVHLSLAFNPPPKLYLFSFPTVLPIPLTILPPQLTPQSTPILPSQTVKRYLPSAENKKN